MRTTISLVALLSVSLSAQAPTVDQLLDRMAAYLKQYEEQLSSVVADERFDQKFASLRTRNVGMGTSARVKRTIDSEVSFIRLPGQNEWLGFRDVRKINGVPLRDTGLRLTELLRRGSADQAKAIAYAGAAHNLGLPRTINVPTAVLEVLHPSHRGRFHYSVAGSATVRKQAVTVIAFREVARPTLVRQPDGGNIVSSGRAWVDPRSGRIVRVEWFYDSEPADPAMAVRPKLLVEFELNPELGILVPTRMEEVFGVPYGTGDGVAVYRNFRRFGTTARVVPQQP
jgi:hypothetical protein